MSAEKLPKSAVNGTVQSDVKLNGKTVLITGANQGIGFETALDLASRGARLIMGCRDLESAEAAKTKIMESTPNAEIVVKKLDLASLETVREFAKEVNETESRLDVLINNAGIMGCPQWKTKEGFEMHVGVNHIGHFLLTNLLLDLIKRSAPSRIVILSSIVYKNSRLDWNDIMHENSYNPMHAYRDSKLINILHCLELSKRLEGTGVTCNCLHPGVVRTGLFSHVRGDHMPWFQRMLIKASWPLIRGYSITPKQGAQTSIYCAIAPELEKVTGKYFNKCAEDTLNGVALKKEDREKLWELSEEWTKSNPPARF